MQHKVSRYFKFTVSESQQLNLKGYSDPDEETKDQVSQEDDCLLQMNQFFRQKLELDTSFYARQIFPAVHIADFKLVSK